MPADESKPSPQRQAVTKQRHALSSPSLLVTRRWLTPGEKFNAVPVAGVGESMNARCWRCQQGRMDVTEPPEHVLPPPRTQRPIGRVGDDALPA